MLNIRWTQIPLFQRKRQRALVLTCMTPCASAPSACQAANAVVLIHDRGGDGIHWGGGVPGGAESNVCPEASCELNVECTVHYICGCHTM